VKRIIAAILVLCGIGFLLQLGVWQLHRLAWKEDLIARIAKYQMENVDLTPYVRDDTAEFRRGELKGHWDSASTFRTRNVLMNDNFGYWVVTPLVLKDGTQLIVNRGWVQDGQQDRVLQRALPTGEVTVFGSLRRPGLLDKEKIHMTHFQGPWVLFMDHSIPADHPELQAAPVAVELWNHHKEYAIFWFTMAGVLCAMAVFSLLKGRSASSPNP